MKNRNNKWLSYCIGACMIAGTALAQVGIAPSGSTETSSSRTDTTRSTQFLGSKELVGTNVKDSQGNKIGDIKELYLNPHNGLTLATIDISGPREAVVPLQALKVSEARGILGTKVEIMVNKTKAELESGPTIASNELNKLDDSAFTHQVFAAYNVQMPAGMGGSEFPGGTSTGRVTEPK